MVTVALPVRVLDGLDGELTGGSVETSEIGELEHHMDYLYEVSW
jgi:hypothetical protein